MMRSDFAEELRAQTWKAGRNMKKASGYLAAFDL
jgi:hypothetical protein